MVVLLKFFQFLYTFSNDGRVVSEYLLFLTKSNMRGEAETTESVVMPYRLLCNDVQREGVKSSPGLNFGLFCYAPLHDTLFSRGFGLASKCYPLWYEATSLLRVSTRKRR
jgi:hypothetical protein